MCYSLWETATDDDYGDADPSSLPISQDLVQKLDEWAESYTATLDQKYPPDSGFETPEAAEAFIQ